MLKAGAKPKCERFTIAADLAEPLWPEKLITAGFDKNKPSVFLLEGLLAYLEPADVDALMKTVAGLCNANSILLGKT